MTGRRAAILVVDDDHGFCEFVTTLCENAGLDVLAAGEADSAMATADFKRGRVGASASGYGLQLCRECCELSEP